ncbi:MAG: cupin domain-containing protein [Candidatus Thiodiazotropha sp.]
MTHKPDKLIELSQQFMLLLESREVPESPEVAGNLLQALDELDRHLGSHEHQVEPRQQVKRNLMAAIKQDNHYPGFISRLMQLFDLPKQQIVSLLKQIPDGADLPCDGWQKSAWNGIYLLHFSGGQKVANQDCGLIYLRPGATFPNHRHKGEELALVMQGCVIENANRIYQPGDLIIKRARSQHSFSATEDEIAVIAVVVEKGIRIMPT